MSKKFKHITFDEIRGAGTLRKRFLISPSQDNIFDERGEIIGKYCIRNTKHQTLVLV